MGPHFIEDARSLFRDTAPPPLFPIKISFNLSNASDFNQAWHCLFFLVSHMATPASEQSWINNFSYQRKYSGKRNGESAIRRSLLFGNSGTLDHLAHILGAPLGRRSPDRAKFIILGQKIETRLILRMSKNWCETQTFV